MAVKSFVRMSKLSDIVGRSNYISDKNRQENIVAKQNYADWKLYQEYERNHRKSSKANNEGRELIIALPNEWHTLKEIEITYRMNMLSQKLLPDKYEYQWAVHWNKKNTNLHAHLIFSERSREYGEKGVWDRDIYLTADGKVARRKSDRAVDSNGNVKPPVHRKGEPKSDGKAHFSAKDKKYKSAEWLEQVKVDVEEFFRGYGAEIDKRDLLHQYHEGKGSHSALIHAKNERIKAVNELFSIGQNMGIQFPERLSADFWSMLETDINGGSPISFENVMKYAVKSSKISMFNCSCSKPAFEIMKTKLKEKNICCHAEYVADSKARLYVLSSEKEQVMQLLDSINKEMKKTDINEIVRLKHDYVEKYCTWHYLKTAQFKSDYQNKYQGALKLLKQFKLEALEVINGREDCKRTLNPFKRHKLNEELKANAKKLEDTATYLQSTFKIAIGQFDGMTVTPNWFERILDNAKNKLPDMQEQAEKEAESNKTLQELIDKGIDEKCVREALRTFREACSAVPTYEREKVYRILSNAHTPPLSFENEQFRFSKGRLTSSEDVKKAMEILKTVSQVTAEQQRSISRKPPTRSGFSR